MIKIMENTLNVLISLLFTQYEFAWLAYFHQTMKASLQFLFIHTSILWGCFSYTIRIDSRSDALCNADACYGDMTFDINYILHYIISLNFSMHVKII